MFIADYHTHTIVSPDAYSTADEMISGALKAGVSEIAITDHCEYKSFHNGGDFVNSGMFINPVKYEHNSPLRITVVRGIELGQPHHDMKKALITELLNAGLDVILASVHIIRGMPDFCSIDYRAHNHEKILNQYCREILELVQWGGFDILAHLTYPLRYMRGVWGFNARFSDMSVFKQIFKEMIKRDITLEINTSGMRNNLKDCMPGMEFVELYRDCGGKLISVGSDSHFPEHIGFYIKEVYGKLRALGFKNIATYRKRNLVLREII